MSNTGTHPEILSLIRKRDFIHQNLLYGNYPTALNQMLLLIEELKPADIVGEGDKLISKLEGALRELDQIRGHDVNETASLRLQIFNKKKRDYFTMLRGVNILLWGKGYLSNSKYGMFYTSEQ